MLDFAAPSRGQLIIDPPRPAAINMAIDEVLLDEAATTGVMTLRFYQWQHAAVSLGYFQRYADRQQHASSCHCPLVRRASGGGAIVHDVPACDLTYSIAMPGVPRRQAAQQSLYRLFHQTMVNLLRQRSADARLCQRDLVSTPKPFLCFQRHTQGDVLIGKSKIMGSAQRRQATAVLQHGSLLLARSAAAPELPGLAQVAGGAWSSELIQAEWLEQLNSVWAVDWKPTHLAADQLRQAEAKGNTKYAHFRWNQRR